MTARRRFVRRLAGGTAAAALAGLLFAPAQAQKPPGKTDPAAKAEEPWPDAQRLADAPGRGREPAPLRERGPSRLHPHRRLRGDQPGPRSGEHQALRRSAAPPGRGRQRPIGSGATQRARPRAAEPGRVRGRPAAARVRQGGSEGHGARGPARAEAGDALRQRRRPRAVRADGVPGLQAVRPVHAGLVPDAPRPGDIRRSGPQEDAGRPVRNPPRERRGSGPPDGGAALPDHQPAVQVPRSRLGHFDGARPVHDRQHRLLDHGAAQRQARTQPAAA